jgi:hypothetical protein
MFNTRTRVDGGDGTAVAQLSISGAEFSVESLIRSGTIGRSAGRLEKETR